MEAMDFENGDGKIQLAEFTAYLEAILNAKFAQYDVDHSETLTLDEMTKVVNDLCHGPQDERQRKKDKHYVANKKEWFMKNFDKDSGGSVSPFEFQAYFLREIDAKLKNWKPGKELPYCLRAAVNVNPGQISKKVKKIEAIEAKRVEKNQAIGVYEEDVFHVPDVTSKEDMKQVEAPKLSEEEKINRDEVVKKEAAKAEEKRHAVETCVNKMRESKGKEVRDFEAEKALANRLFKLGDEVEANMSTDKGPLGVWYPGKIQKVYEKELKYDIKYDDDHDETAVEEANIRVPLGHQGPAAAELDKDGKRKNGTCGCNLM